MTLTAEQLIRKLIYPDRWMYPPKPNSHLWSVWRKLYGPQFKEAEITHTRSAASRFYFFQRPEDIPASHLSSHVRPSAASQNRPRRNNYHTRDSSDIVHEFHRAFGEVTATKKFVSDYVHTKYHHCPDGIRYMAIDFIASYFCCPPTKGIGKALFRFEKWAFREPERRSLPAQILVEQGQAYSQLARIGISLCDRFINAEDDE